MTNSREVQEEAIEAGMDANLTLRSRDDGYAQSDVKWKCSLSTQVLQDGTQSRPSGLIQE